MTTRRMMAPKKRRVCVKPVARCSATSTDRSLHFSGITTRQPKPFYRKLTLSFYVQLDGRWINLVPGKSRVPTLALAHRRVDAAAFQKMNQSAKSVDEPEAVTVRQLVKR